MKDTKNIYRYVFIIFIHLFSFHLSAQNFKDLEKFSSEFYRNKLVKCDKSLEWCIFNKVYELNADTLIVVNNRKEEIELIKASNFSFIGEQLYFIKENHLWNMNLNSKNISSIQENIKEYNTIPSFYYYYTLDSVGQFNLLNLDNIIVDTYEDVIEVIIKEQKHVGIIVKERNRYQLIDPITRELIFSSTNMFKVLEIKENYYLISEFESNKKKINCILFVEGEGWKNKNLITLAQHQQIEEIYHSKNLIKYEIKTIINRNNEFVELWYEQESNFKSISSDSIKKDILKFDRIKGEVTNEIKNNEIFTLNDSYILNISSDKNFNYLTKDPPLVIKIINTDEDKIVSKFKISKHTYHSPEIYLSKKKEYLLTFSASGFWVITHIKTGRQNRILKKGLSNPLFTSEDEYILFESDFQILKYNLDKKELTPVTFEKRIKAQIVNYKKEKLSKKINIYTKWIDNIDNLLLYNVKAHNNSISILNNNVNKIIVKETSNSITILSYDSSLEKILISEENFNLFPTIKLINTVNLINENILSEEKRFENDRILKKEIISYKVNNEILYGTLFYPSNYTSSQKYPMVVKIYERQLKYHNKYLYPSYHLNSDGFNARTLVENGYFVFLPDIIFTKKGTGISGLECVKKSLNKLKNIESIDFNKVGLIGHSHGGYLTNYIATHSNLFKTYISGAGNSDIVRSYFSYNHNYKTPFYWQFESEQYKMPFSFSKNKKLYLINNPIINVDKVKAPILLWAGKKDQNIDWDQVMQFYIGLKRNNKKVIALFYPFQGHDLSFRSKETLDLTHRVLEWWDYFLKDNKEYEWIHKLMKKDAN